MTDKNALVTFLGTLAFITLVSLLGPLSNGLPDGIITPDEFSGLSIPMHIIAVSFYSVMIVRSVTRS